MAELLGKQKTISRGYGRPELYSGLNISDQFPHSLTMSATRVQGPPATKPVRNEFMRKDLEELCGVP